MGSDSLLYVAAFGLLSACGSSSSSNGDAGPGRDARVAGDGGATDGKGASDAGDRDVAGRDVGAHHAPDAGKDAPTPARLVAYASGYEPDIDVFSVGVSSGGLTPASSTMAFGSNPSFLAVDANVAHLYAVDESSPGRVGAYSIDPSSGALTFLDAVSSGGDGPPFVSVEPKGKFVFVANYTDGSVSVLPIETDGSLGAATDTQSVGALAHMAIADPSSRFVFVPCKGADYVAQFLFDSSTGKLTPNVPAHVATASGAGPRHLAFHPNGKYAYLINETNSTMSLYAFDGMAGTLSEVQTVSTIPSTFTGTNTAAEVHVHPDGAWLFGSNRGDDSLVVFALDASGEMTLRGFTPSGGTTPRDFSLDPSGAFVYAANQGTGNLVTFRFDAAKGTLAQVGSALPLTMASFVGVFALPAP